MFTHTDFTLHSAFAVLLIALNNLGILLHILPSQPQLATEAAEIEKDLSHNIVIVTGSNTGIGKSTARKLAMRGATVVLACRNVKQGMKAMMDITNTIEKCDDVKYPFCRNGKVFFMRMDLSNLQSIVDFVGRFKEQFNRLDILVNNAGLNTSTITTNGLEQLFQVNYLGHYLLTSLLTDYMTNVDSVSDNAPSVARVVNLSSVMHHLGQGDFKSSAFSAYSPAMTLKGYSYYSDSKVYMNLLTMELNRRYDTLKPYGDTSEEETPLDTAGIDKTKQKRPLVSLCVNPGAVHSDIWRNSILSSLNFVMRWIFLTVDQGSATSVHAATMDIEELRAFQRTHAKLFNQAKLGDNYVFCPEIPFLIPYAMPEKPVLAYETMGPFAGSNFGKVSFPAMTSIQGERDENVDTPAKLARKLWDYSAQLCESQMNVSNVTK